MSVVAFKVNHESSGLERVLPQPHSFKQSIPNRHALFVSLYCLTGIPIFAMALGQFANILIERHIAAREQRATWQQAAARGRYCSWVRSLGASATH